MISVIIPQGRERTFLLRCLNSIQRQSTKDIEVLLVDADCPPEIMEEYGLKVIVPECVGGYAGLDRSIREASGEYLFFCSMTSVLPEDTLEILEHINRNNEIYTFAPCYIPNGKNFKKSEESLSGFYGKLFMREKVLKNGIRFQNAGAFAGPLFVLEYLRDTVAVDVRDDVYIYETDPAVLGFRDFYDAGVEELKMGLKLCAEAPETVKRACLTGLADVLSKNRALSAQLMFPAAEHLPGEYEFLNRIAGNILKEWMSAAVNEQDDSAYGQLKIYLSMFEPDEGFLKFLLAQCSLCMEQYAYLRDYDLQSFLFFKDQVPKQVETGKLEAEVDELRKQLAKSAAQWERLAFAVKKGSAEGNTLPGKHGNPQPEALNGPALAEFIIEKYREGGLGIRTILRSFGAWLRYKL